MKIHYAALAPIVPAGVELLYALDHCTDGTAHCLGLIAADDVRVRFAHNDSSPGLFNCRNFAARQARGDYVQFLDDDDSVSAGFYTRVQDVIARQPELDLIVTDLMVNREGEPAERKPVVDHKRVQTVQRDAFELLLGDLFLPILTGGVYIHGTNAVFSRRLLARYPFRGEIAKTADWLMYLEASLREPLRVAYVPGVEGIYNIHASSMSVASDKSYWTMRAFRLLLDMAPRYHPAYRNIRSAFAKAAFDAGYGLRQNDRIAALACYWQAFRHGLGARAILAAMKLCAPKAVLRDLAQQDNSYPPPP